MANTGDFSQRLKEQADIVRVIGDYVKLKKAGAQNFSGICPFHQEKTPSFFVHATRQFFHCFGCGVSGDVFSFVQKIENVTFPEAVRMVAQKLGIALPRMEYSSPAEAQEARQRGQLLDIHERACVFFEEQLRKPEAAHALYNLDKAKEAIRKLDYGIIVEGQMDCISVYASGFHNVIASSGTAFTETQVRLLARFSKNIVVNFDPDTAGAAATDRSLAMLVEEDFNIKVMRLETGFDPDLFIRRNGVDAYRKALQVSTKYFDYLIGRAISMFPVRTPEGKVKAVNYLLPHIQKVPSRIVREGLATDLAQKLGIDSAVLRQELKSAATRRSSAEIRTGGEMQVIPSEKVLIRAASSAAPEDVDLRRIACDALATERLHAGLATESLLEALVAAGEQQDDPMALPLSDLDRQLLARIIMTEDVPLSPEFIQQALDALRHRTRLAQRERDIKRAFSEAERRNDVMTLVRLKQEKLELDRK